MMRDTTPDVKLTWEQMDTVLSRLGYVKQIQEGVRAYREERTSTILLFPDFSQTDKVAHRYLLQARVNSILRGVVTEKEFDSALFSEVQQTDMATAA